VWTAVTKRVMEGGGSSGSSGIAVAVAVMGMAMAMGMEWIALDDSLALVALCCSHNCCIDIHFKLFNERA